MIFITGHNTQFLTQRIKQYETLYRKQLTKFILSIYDANSPSNFTLGCKPKHIISVQSILFFTYL